MNHYIERVDCSALRESFIEFLNENHPLGYCKRPTRRLQYLLFEDDFIVGAMEFCSAFYKVRDVLIEARSNNISFNEIANNSRFCISGSEDKNAGSKFLALCRKDASEWWTERYGDKLKAFQTFVSKPNTGAVYKADNWEIIGRTCGVSSSSKTYAINDANTRRAKVDYENKKNMNERKEVKTVSIGSKILIMNKKWSPTSAKLIFWKLNN